MAAKTEGARRFMPKLSARRGNRQAGWIKVPEQQGFGWSLRLFYGPKSSVTVPIRVHTADRGWTQYFFAELDSLTETQLEMLAANQIFEPVREDAA